MAKVTASASINRPTRVKLRFDAGTGLFIFLSYGDAALHLRVDRAVIGVGPGFGKGRGERRTGALQAGLKAASSALTLCWFPWSSQVQVIDWPACTVTGSGW